MARQERGKAMKLYLGDFCQSTRAFRDSSCKTFRVRDYGDFSIEKIQDEFSIVIRDVPNLFGAAPLEASERLRSLLREFAPLVEPPSARKRRVPNSSSRRSWPRSRK